MANDLEARARREELLEKIVCVLLARGVSALSLRPLAKATGTSARLLIYHFGSKEALLAAALRGVRARIETALRALAKKEKPRSTEDFLLMFWHWAIADPNQDYFRLLYEVDGLVLQDRAKYAEDFSSAGIATWLGLLEGGVLGDFAQGKDGRARATFVHAALNGLIQDFLSTGDRKRTTDALHVLLEVVSPHAVRRRSAAGRK